MMSISHEAILAQIHSLCRGANSTQIAELENKILEVFNAYRFEILDCPSCGREYSRSPRNPETGISELTKQCDCNEPPRRKIIWTQQKSMS